MKGETCAIIIILEEYFWEKTLNQRNEKFADFTLLRFVWVYSFAL